MARSSSRAFSLIELLVVVAIIVVVVAIIIPSLGGARTVARETQSKALLSDIASASGKFTLDNGGRVPGYFTPAEMGSGDNATQGLTGMENLLLDLAGAEAVFSSDDTDRIEVNPLSNGSPIYVNPDLLGSGTGNYLTIDQGNLRYEEQASNAGDLGQIAATGFDGSRSLPDVVDAFGQPLLVWTEDAAGPSKITDFDEFAVEDSDADPAHFYWNQNASILNSGGIGKKLTDVYMDSLLGGSAQKSKRERTLTAILGNPGYPANLADPLPAVNTIYPSAARGKMLVQAAGADGVYLSLKDKKGRGLISSNQLNYGSNFPAVGETDDLIKQFDDLFISAGN
ncbi:MAG: prepilin-type N-terminal cleavage/methylation domain-containing protein [Phycisphaerales bacterium]|jgi:prepilin-type N-terminal cleavage/methylation domain-containing protein|nr:prepilin-type N-terminal cleavage/methylation domain-containing protein [Phycisphaerales bacterium]